MNVFRKIDAVLDKAAASLVQGRHTRAVKVVLACALCAAAIWVPYSLIHHVYTSGFYLVSVEREARVGSQMADVIRQDNMLKENDDAVSLYVSEIGAHITRENNPWQADFSFSVIEDNCMVNAFAVPGGRIYITTGLLDRLDNEAELASVLAHEVAHVTRRHYARNVGRQMLMSWVKKFLGSTDKTILDTGSFLTANVTLLKMRQEDELEADYQGGLYLYELDYDPTGSITLMKKLLDLEKQMPEYIRVMAFTHPPSRERLEAMTSLRDSFPEKETLTLGEERFRQIIKSEQARPEKAPR
jgi:predicted Zn-dependent protease